MRRKFLPIFIFVSIGLGIMYFSLAYFDMHCLTSEKPQVSCAWYDILCNANAVISASSHSVEQTLCLQQENLYKLILLGVGGVVTIIGVMKY